MDKNNIYFITDLAEWGELNSLLKWIHCGKLNVECAKFVVAEIVQALEYLHRNGIAHW